MRLLALTAWMVFCVPAMADDDAPINLLQSASIERSDPPGFSQQALESLTDGNAATTASLAVPAGSSIEIVLQLAGEIASPEELIVRLPGQTTRETAPTEIEIMVSTISPHAAFQALRKEPLQVHSRPQVFRFRPTAARWVLIRLTLPPSAETVELAELHVVGRPGPPATLYAFKESPAEALQVLKSLEESVSSSLTDEEAALFAKVHDGRLDDEAFAQAALLASGLSEQQLTPYLERLDRLEAQARAALADARDPFDKGERLLRWLHSEVLTDGYQEQQTHVDAILDQKTYNCASSATLYNILAGRLGLDVRAIEVPDHAFSIVYDGTRSADVETTTPEGFNPARNPRVIRELEQRNLRYIPDRNRDLRREVREAGLAAMLYYNRGVELTEQKRYPEALAMYFRALSLDPESASAVKNVLAVLVNWGNELASAGRFERALEVLQVGLELAPEDAKLHHNRKAAWSQWAESLVQGGDPDQALEVLRQAHAAVEDNYFLTKQAWVFIQPGEQQAKEGRWEQSLAAATAGFERLKGPPREELVKWRNGLFLRCSSAELEAERFERAAQVLGRGLATDPEDQRLVNNLAYVAQQWSWSVYEQAGREKSAGILRQMIAEHAIARDRLQRVADQFVRRVTIQLQEDGQFEEALRAIDDCRRLLATDEAAARIQQSVYDAWAGTHLDAGQWDQAIKVYNLSLERMPGQRHLENNAQAVWDMWASQHMTAKEWDEALAVYRRAIDRFPELRRFRNNLRYVALQALKSQREQEGAEAAEAWITRRLEEFGDTEELPDLVQAIQQYFEQTVSESVKAEQYDEALKAIDRGVELIGAEQIVRAARIACDQWARQLTRDGQWSDAVAVYRRGLERFPDDSHLSRNAVATWNAWAADPMKNQDWDAAIEVYEKSLEQFPNNRTLENNLQYCRQQKERT